MARELVLLIEDEPSLRLATGRYLTHHDYELSEAATIAAAEMAFRARRPDIVLSDYQLPDGNGLEMLKKVRAVDKDVPFILLTGHGSIDLAVKAIKEGADQFLTKPADLPALVEIMERLLETRRQREAQLTLQEKDARGNPDPFVGTSDAVKLLHEQAERLAQSDGPLLILGETGSGKGVLTRWIHANGPRAKERFVDLNCAGLSRELLENELFGHERGAFTGAQNSKQGLLEVANKGSLFLDEIGDVDIQVQPRLLKVLEESRFRRLGDTKDRTVDVRLIAATHHDLEKAVAEKHFRSDLFYRISVLPVRIPPLRERPEDVPALARQLLKPGVQLSKAAEKALAGYRWPGNVRELRNVLERAMVLSRKAVLEPSDLQLSASAAPPPADEEGGPLTLDEVERRHIERILRREKGKVAKAAEVLNISRSSLYQKLQRYHIDADPPEG